MRCSSFKGLLFFLSLLLVVVVFYSVHALGTKPDGWRDAVSAKRSGDGDSVFWWNDDQDYVVVRQREDVLFKKEAELNQLDWSADGTRLYFSRYIEEQRQLGWFDMTGRERVTSVAADWFLPASQGEGVYVFRFTGNGGCEVSFWNGKETAPLFNVFGHLTFEIGGIAGAKISGNGRYLAVGAWGYNDPDGVEVWDLHTKKKVLEDQEEASAFFFVGEKDLYTVRSTAAIVQLHHYDLENGKKVRSSEEFSGSAVADISRDGRLIAIGRAGFDDEKTEHLEVFTTEGLQKVNSVTLKDTRRLIDVEWVGGEVHAVDRTGGLWEIDTAEMNAVKVGSIIPAVKDRRGWVVGGMAIAVILAVVWSFRVRRRLIDVELGDKGVLTGIIVAAVLVEGFSWLFLFSNGLLGGLGWFFFHFLLGCGLLVYALWIAVLKLPERWRFLAPAVFVAFAGSGLKLFVVVSAINSV